MLRNDGIGGEPRLARYVSIGTPRTGGTLNGPTQGRPLLPQRIPGETDPDRDTRFRLTGARDAAPAPRSKATLAESVEIARATLGARESVKGHMPSRHGDCPKCGESTPCRPFRRALAILDRHDEGTARRVRAILQVLALPAPGLPDRSAE